MLTQTRVAGGVPVTGGWRGHGSCVSIDCADAAALAGFWSEVLGRPVNWGAGA